MLSLILKNTVPKKDNISMCDKDSKILSNYLNVNS